MLRRFSSSNAKPPWKRDEVEGAESSGDLTTAVVVAASKPHRGPRLSLVAATPSCPCFPPRTRPGTESYYLEGVGRWKSARRARESQRQTEFFMGGASSIAAAARRRRLRREIIRRWPASRLRLAHAIDPPIFLASDSCCMTRWIGITCSPIEERAFLPRAEAAFFF